MLTRLAEVSGLSIDTSSSTGLTNWIWRVTAVAASQRLLPACVAVIEQVVSAGAVSWPPTRVQAPESRVRVTGRPEEAVAVRATGAGPLSRTAGGAKLIDWACGG